MALQEISLSTAAVQAPASSGGSSSGTSAADPAFLLLMQTDSAAPQGRATARAASDGSQEGQPSGDADPSDPKTALPYDASALAALFALQAAQNPNAVLPEAGQASQTQTAPVQAVQQNPGAAQAAPAQLAPSAVVSQSTALLQAVPAQTGSLRQSSAAQTAFPVSEQKAETVPAAVQQLPSAAAQASDPGAPAQAVASADLPLSAEAAPQATLASQAALTPQQTSQAALAPQVTAQSGQIPQTALASAATTAPQTQQGPPDRIVVLSSDGSAGGALPAGDTRSAGAAQAAGGIQNGADPAAVQAQGGAQQTQQPTQQIQTAQQNFAGSTGSSGREDHSSAADPASTAAALYTGGKVVIKVSDRAAQTQASPSRQVADAVAEGFQSGVKQLKVDLYPEALGKVSVKLVSKDGLLTVQLAAENARTQDLIASSSGDIRSMLQNATGQNVQVTRPDQAAAQQWYAQDGGAGGQGQQQQQESGRRKKDEEPYPAGGVGAISTDDFLTMMRRTAGA